MLNTKPKTNCRWDLVSLGELLLRFDSVAEGIQTLRNLRGFDGAVPRNRGVYEGFEFKCN